MYVSGPTLPRALHLTHSSAPIRAVHSGAMKFSCRHSGNRTFGVIVRNPVASFMTSSRVCPACLELVERSKRSASMGAFYIPLLRYCLPPRSKVPSASESCHARGVTHSAFPNIAFIETALSPSLGFSQPTLSLSKGILCDSVVKTIAFISTVP